MFTHLIFCNNLHIVSSDDVQTKLHLFNSLIWAEYSFMTIINDKVDGLIEPFQCTLKNKAIYINK